MVLSWKEILRDLEKYPVQMVDLFMKGISKMENSMELVSGTVKMDNYMKVKNY